MTGVIIQAVVVVVADLEATNATKQQIVEVVAILILGIRTILMVGTTNKYNTIQYNTVLARASVTGNC